MAMPGRLVFTRPCMPFPPIWNWKRYRPGTPVGPTAKATPLCIMRRLGGMPKAYPDSETTKTRYVVRNRTRVFRIRHAAKDRGGEDGGSAARSNRSARHPGEGLFGSHLVLG
jgi:hypothetical protein